MYHQLKAEATSEYVIDYYTGRFTMVTTKDRVRVVLKRSVFTGGGYIPIRGKHCENFAGAPP